MTLTIGWWAVPAFITIAALYMALREQPAPTGRDYGAGGVIGLMFVMAEKEWVAFDLDEFEDAFLEAVRRHVKAPAFDMVASLQEARWIARKAVAHRITKENETCVK